MLHILFVEFPLWVIFFILSMTLIIPIGYWIITGKNWFDISDLWNLKK